MRSVFDCYAVCTYSKASGTLPPLRTLKDFPKWKTTSSCIGNGVRYSRHAQAAIAGEDYDGR
jgi:hypothetical protein